MDTYYETMSMYRRMQREEDQALTMFCLAVAVIFTFLVLFAVHSATSQAREEHSTMQEQCWTLHGEIRDDGKCWVDDNGDRKVIDLREGK